MNHRKPPGTDTLEQVQAVRERYAGIMGEIRSSFVFARNDNNRLPEYVARATINIRELAELIEQTHILPPPPILVDLLRAYTDLIVYKVQEGI